MNIYEKLMNIQTELKAPKNQFNSFGKYKYRNLEDILEALKPLLLKYKAIINISDEIVLVGDRYYIKATARFIDTEKEELSEFVTSEAYAREDENKKGMDLSQLSGSTSSYARKYALNGLFAIDDTKDSDATNVGATSQPSKPKEEVKAKLNGVLSEAQIKRLFAISNANNVSNEEVKQMMIDMFKKDSTSLLSRKEYDLLIKNIEGEK